MTEPSEIWLSNHGDVRESIRPHPRELRDEVFESLFHSNGI